MASTVHARALGRAAEILGGQDKLRAALNVPISQLETWLQGREAPPSHVFLKVVDIIAGEQVGETRERAMSTVDRARETCEAIFASRQMLAGSPRRAFLEERFEPAQGRLMVESALDAAIEAARADKGNLQVVAEGTLHIVAHRAFDPAFLEFFATVTDGSSACGSALHDGRRFLVPDIASHPLFDGTPAGEALARAGVRAVLSTPLVGMKGVLGIVSTHYTKPYEPSPEELVAIERVAQRTVFWLEGGRL